MSRTNYILGLLVIFLPLFAVAQRNAGISPGEKIYYDKQINQNVALFNATEINSAKTDFSPAFYRDGIVFVSSRRKHGPRDEATGETFFQLYFAKLDPHGLPMKPREFSVDLNSQLHDGPITFNADFTELYFGRNAILGKGKEDRDKVGMHIFEANRGIDRWEDFKELSFNGEGFSSIHPSLSDDGLRLYFASDRSGGQGDFDLYVVERKGEDWGEPENLGDFINTPGKEAFPFIHPSGVLFFASEGHDGLGGFDLFMVDLHVDGNHEVINLGEPFNSDADDISLVINEAGTRGYFSSNREGGFGGDDIYMFEATSAIQQSALDAEANGEAASVKPRQITVADAQTGRELPGTSVRIMEWTTEEGEGLNKFYDVELMPRQDGQGELSLKMVPRPGVDLGPPDAVTEVGGLAQVKGEPGKEYLIILSREGYFPLEKRVKFPESVKGKDFPPLTLMMEPANCIDLQGSVMALGFNKPVPGAIVRIVNECNGEEQMVKSGVAGEFVACLDIGCDYSMVGQHQGFDNGYSSVSTANIRGKRSIVAQIDLRPKEGFTMDELLGSDVKKSLSEGAIIVLEDVFYDFDKTTVREEDAQDLEALAQLMKAYPSMTIQLGAHTDARGSAEYNMSLSLRRAESAKKFLVRQGIAANRIIAFGYGETKPRNHCKDGVTCSDEEHMFNRRTEVKILSIDLQDGNRIKYKDKDIDIKGSY